MFSDTPPLAAGPATEPATRFSREKPIPKGRSRSRRRERRGGVVSFRCRSFGFSPALERVGDSTGVGREFDAVEITRPRQVDFEFLLHPTRMRGKKQDPITQTNRFADVVSDKDNGFAPRFPNALEIAIKLLAGKSIEGGKGLIHQEDTRIRRKGA